MSKKTKKINKPVKILHFLFILFCAMTVVFSFMSFTTGFGKIFAGHTPDYYDLVFTDRIRNLCISGIWLCLSIIVYLIAKSRYISSSHSERSAMIIIALFSFAVRAFFVVLLGKNVSPVSDFANAWQMTKGDFFYLSHYKFFPAYINYAVFMRLIARFFNYNFLSVLWSNAIMGSLTTVGVFLLAKEVFNKDSVSVTAAVLYAFYPASVLYTLINTPEHLCVLAMVFGLYFFLKAVKLQKPVMSFVYALIFGILAGISNSMKSFYPVVLVAVVIMLLFVLLSNRFSPKKLFIAVLILVCVIGAETITMKGISSVSGKLFNMEIDYSAALPHFVFVGLNRQGEGQINLGNISRTFNDLIESGVDADTAKETALEEFKNDWKGHLKEIPSFTVRKLIWGFQDDCSPARLLAISINGDNQQGLSASVTDLLLSSSKEVSQIFYCLLCALCLIASVSIYKSGEKNLNVFFIELVIWGYFCLILLSESQSRYKCLILPYLIITAASLNKKGFSKSKDN